MKELVKKLKILLKRKEIIDIIFFGSIAKGRTSAKDLDVIILSDDGKIVLKKEINEIAGRNVDLQIVGLKDYDRFIWLTMIKEGFSVKHNDYLFNVHKIRPSILYKYSLKQLTNSKKVMFERAIKTFKGVQRLSNSVVLVPIEISSDFSDFLKEWEIDLDSTEYHLLPLVRKEEI